MLETIGSLHLQTVFMVYVTLPDTCADGKQR